RARIPPVVPYAGIDDGRLALMQNARLLFALDVQLALEHGEALDKGGMPVFPHDTRPNESGQLGGRSARRIVPGTLQNRGAFPGHRVFPYLANFYRCAIRRAMRVGVRHATGVSHSDVWSAILKLVLALRVSTSQTGCPSLGNDSERP